MKTIRVFLITMLVVMLAGCKTHLSVKKTLPSGDTATGYVYYLPRTEVSIELERELRSCEVLLSEMDLAVYWLREQAKSNPEEQLSITKVQRLRRKFSDSFDEYNLDFDRVFNEMRDRNRSKNNQDSDPSTIDVDLEIALRATLTPQSFPDTSQSYVIDYMNTKNGMKSTNFTVENYPNGTLKSINMSIDDQAGAILQSTVRGVLALASGFVGLPIPVEAEADAETVASYGDFRQRVRPELCKSEIRSLLEQREVLDKELSAWPAKRQGLEKVVAQRIKTLESKRAELEQAKADGKTSDALAEYEVAIKAAVAKKSEAEAELKKAKDEVAPKNARRDQLRTRLTVTTRMHLIPEEASNKQITGFERARSQWFEDGALQRYCEGNSGLECGGNNIPKALYAYAAIYTPLGRNETNGHQIQCPSKFEGDDKMGRNFCKGVIYRQPATGLLLACTWDECLGPNGKIQVVSDNLIASQTIVIPQLGVPAILPLSNRAFQNNNLQATFAENGMLTKVTYSSNARAEAAAGAFGGSASDVASFLDARREAKKEKRGEAAAELVSEKERVAAQLALEQEIKKLEDFRAGVPVEEDPEPGPGDSSDGGAASDSGTSGDSGG